MHISLGRLSVYHKKDHKIFLRAVTSFQVKFPLSMGQNLTPVKSVLSFFLFFLPALWHEGILVSPPEIKLCPPAVETQSPNHCTAREVPKRVLSFPSRFTLCSALGGGVWITSGGTPLPSAFQLGSAMGGVSRKLEGGKEQVDIDSPD